MIIDILSRENNEMENGDIDKQIILDFESYIQEQKDYQENHLDKKVKGVSHRYEEWVKENQDRIRYAERIVELAEMAGKIGRECDGSMAMPNDLISKRALIRLLQSEYQSRTYYYIVEGVMDYIEKIPIGCDMDKVVQKIEDRIKLLQIARIPKSAKTAANNAFLMAIEDIKSGGIE